VGVEIFNSKKKLIAIIFIIAIVLNLILFAVGLISQFLFWIIVILIAVIAYKILPKLK
jgi:MFS-type transporter involved in bile tolerance (Atg22 family)